MNKFGFTTQESRSIDYNKFDERLIGYVHQHEPSFFICMSCGACTATCSAGNLIDFNIRRISLLIRRGEIFNYQMKLINACFVVNAN